MATYEGTEVSRKCVHIENEGIIDGLSIPTYLVDDDVWLSFLSAVGKRSC